MALVTVQVGQAGNQVGCEFFDAVMSNGGADVEERFFSAPVTAGGLPRARAVMIDMEPKVSAAGEAVPIPLRARLSIFFFLAQVITACHEHARAGGKWRYHPSRQVRKAGCMNQRMFMGGGVRRFAHSAARATTGPSAMSATGRR